jgi:DNA-directed RNA polymerase specialized sigma24 family protein
MKSWLFTILRNIWFNQLRRRRNAPQEFEIESGAVADNIAEPSKNSHDLYVKNVWSVGLISGSAVCRDRLAICLFATLVVWH